MVRVRLKRRLHFTLLIAAVLTLTFPHVSLVRSAPSAVSFTTTSHVLLGGVILDSSPTLADLAGPGGSAPDGIPEIIVGTTAYNAATGQRNSPTYLVAWYGTGTPLFQVNVGAPIKSAPAVGDIDGDGDPEVVVSLGGDSADPDHHGGIMVYNRLGQAEWATPFYTDNYPPDNGYADGVYSSPLLCDLDADGDMEIAFGAWDHRIYLLDHNGNSLWQDPFLGGEGIFNADTIWSSAACADLDKDGDKEVIIGADISDGGVMPDGTRPENGGFIYIIDKDGTILVRRWISEAVYSAPAIGDLDADGDLEIVVGTSFVFWLRDGRQPYVYAFDTSEVFGPLHYSDPDKLPYEPGWPKATYYPGFSSPALADLDGDDDLEIVIGTGKPTGMSQYCSNNPSDPDCYGAIYAWHHNGSLVSGFPVWPKDDMNHNSFVRSSPVIGDIDNDGNLEILFAMTWDIIVLQANGTKEYNLDTDYSVFASPAIGDTDGDGRVDIWIGGGHYNQSSNKGRLWHFESGTSGIGDMPWPMFHRDAQNTGRYPAPPRLDAAPESLIVLHQYGSGPSEDSQLTVTNLGDGEIDWEVAVAPSRVDATPSSGAVTRCGQRVDVTIDTSGLSEATYDLGTVTLTGTAGGEEVENSPVDISVTLYVGEVQNIFVPLVLNEGD